MEAFFVAKILAHVFKINNVDVVFWSAISIRSQLTKNLKIL